MHLLVVSNFYPDRRANSEYGWHLVEGLRQARPENRVTVLAGSPGDADDGVQRGWTYGGLRVAGEMCAAARRLRPDAVLVNASFNAWGNNVSNLSAFWGIRCLSRQHRTLALLHYLPQTLPRDRAVYRLGPLHWAGIGLACRMAASAQVVAFTLERDRRYFSEHFSTRSVKVEHGLLGPLGSAGWEEEGGHPTLLAFGYWGPGKNLEQVLRVVEADERLHLVVAGASHPRFPGYVEALRVRHPSPRIRWLGYVAESELSTVFRRARLIVLPYGGDTGTSGVLHMACQHGRAILASDIGILRHESERLGLAVDFFADDDELRRRIAERLHDADRLLEDGRRNVEALRHLSMRAVGERWWQLAEGTPVASPRVAEAVGA